MVVRSPVRRRGRRGVRRTALIIILVVALVALLVIFLYPRNGQQEPVILYVNQGNGVVNGTNFGAMLSFASSHGFNTIFFQVYRSGVLLFSRGELGSFANQSHAQSLAIYFALYFTNSSQSLPSAIFGLGEDGISLDVSTLSLSAQEGLLGELAACHCQTAVTTTDMGSPLKPDHLILETYGPSFQQYIRHGIIASVGVFETTGPSDYQSQFQYALGHSDGVMVFDYAGLMKSGY